MREREIVGRSLPSRREDRGFTIIEILVAVAIIAVLVLLASLISNWALDFARQKKTVAVIKVIGTALHDYSSVYNDYPNPCGEGNDCLVKRLKPYLEPSFINHLPVEDGWGRDVHYRYSETSWDLDEGPDGGPSGDDEGADGFDEDEDPDYGPGIDFTFELISFGRDGIEDSMGNPGAKLDEDIVYNGSAFSKW